MARDIGVWLFGQSVGTLSLLNGRLSFQYHHDGLALPNAVACRRRSKSEPPRRLNIEPGVEADVGMVGCG